MASLITMNNENIDLFAADCVADTNSQLPKPRPVVRWAGGKQRLLKYILPLIPRHTAYIEVFGGGLAVFAAKAPSPVEVINDRNRELVSFYRCCKYHLDALLDELDLVLNSRVDFEDYTSQPGLTEIQRGARWFMKNRLSFAGGGTSFSIQRTTQMPSRAQRLLAIRSLSHRLDHTTIECRDWNKILDTYDHPESLFFLDPPYPEAGGDNYDGWSQDDLAAFCRRVRTLKGQWIFTFKDCAEVRALMAGYKTKSITRAKCIYNRAGAGRGVTYQEIIITSEAATAKARSATPGKNTSSSE